jgi:tyrosinase
MKRNMAKTGPQSHVKADDTLRTKLTRRQFLVATGAAVSLTTLGDRLFQSETVYTAPIVRRDIAGLAPDDPILTSYIKAITVMQALPSTNPLSWTYQAEIHRNSCEHWTNFFWPWHRMFLYRFERIIRKMSGNSGWSLPYWDWTSPAEVKLPAPFRDYRSVLYTQNRNPSINDGSLGLDPNYLTYAAAFNYLDFPTANYLIQDTPHGYVHTTIGGWMADTCTAALDPIFFLHHCNVDRLWNAWLFKGGTDPLKDKNWTDRTFTFFNEDGNQVEMSPCQILRAEQQLNYTYENEPKQIRPDCENPTFEWRLKTIQVVRLNVPEIVLSSQTTVLTIEFNLAQGLPDALEGQRKLILQLEEVETEHQPDTIWEVYVALPANTQPHPESPHYVGNVLFFGKGIRDQACHGFARAHFSFLINGAVTPPLPPGGKVSLTFVPRSLRKGDGRIEPDVKSNPHIGRILLITAVSTKEVDHT